MTPVAGDVRRETKISTSAPPKAATNHLSYIDGLRALAASYVVLHHAKYQLTLTDPLLVRAWYPFAFGHYAVSVFIVISGFCLMLPVIRADGQLRGGAIGFYMRRVRRILPPYYLAIAASLTLIFFLIGKKTGTHWDVSIPVTARDVVAHLLFVQDLWADTFPKINHAFWSISVEWRIYFLFPLFVALRRRIGGAAAAACALIGSCALFLWLEHSAYRDYLASCPHYVGLFAIGLYAAEIAYGKGRKEEWLRSRLPWIALAPGSTALLLAAMLKLATQETHDTKLLADLVVGVWSLCILVAGGMKDFGWLHGLLAWRPLVFLGGFAYSIYLIHAPILQLFTQYVSQPMRLSGVAESLAHAFIASPLAIAASYGFYLLCERPFVSKPRNPSA